jgi:SAM-dependent methyltransferase
VRRTAAAALRNREVLLELLRRVLPARGTVLELGSGTGEHAVFLARALPGLVWQPSDPDPLARASIEAWAEEANLPNLRPPLLYDLVAPAWTRRPADAILCVNVLHVAAGRAGEALLAGAAAVLPPGGPLVVYGPFRRPDEPGPAPPERLARRARLARIDAAVRAADPEYGVRDASALEAAAARHRLSLSAEAPGAEAGDLILVLRRT